VVTSDLVVTIVPVDEDQALETAAGYDTGQLAELIAALAHEVAYQPDITADEYRQLGAMCFVMARRMDASRKRE
jgi:hypothetical protein